MKFLVNIQGGQTVAVQSQVLPGSPGALAA